MQSQYSVLLDRVCDLAQRTATPGRIGLGQALKIVERGHASYENVGFVHGRPVLSPRFASSVRSGVPRNIA
jgi:hypothetical protein